MNMLKLNQNLALLCLSGLLTAVTASAAGDPLESGFNHPPDTAKPQTWWHWMNGNISKAGITADLEAMKRIGLGGATIVNADCEVPHGPVAFMSPEWREDFKFAVQEANRLGLDLCVENCAGWSSSGGPWMTPEHAMKRVVSSEVRVTGPAHFNDALPQPPTKLDYYRDIAVLAFPAIPDEDVRMKDFAPATTLSSGGTEGNLLTDGNENTFVRLPNPEPGKPSYAQLEFKDPFPARALKIVLRPGVRVKRGEIQTSDDGQNFRTLRTFSVSWDDSHTLTMGFGEQKISARFWRIKFAEPADQTKEIRLAEFELKSCLTIDSLDTKIGYGMNALTTSNAATATAGSVQRPDMVDLTSKLTADGHLDWTVPAGQWVILRVGYTPTGVNNHPAPKEGTGLECDKFSKAALDAHWSGFMQKILEDVGPLAGKTLTSSLIDSYEVGCQNWSEDFRREFQQRRGYDPLKFLPLFTGRVVDNPALSERFLWDLRRTIADLFAENYFGHFAELCHGHGLLNAVEPYTGPFESMQSGAPADVVMGEFWCGSQWGGASVRLAASIAHTYGKTIVGAESFTAQPKDGRWQNDPSSLKALGDMMYANGLNRFIFHRYAMQPWTNRWPGMTMGQWGFHFERTVTWWEQGKGWIDYISRCQFLLQQGRAIADAAYFTGQNSPVLIRIGQPALPEGYDYDAVNADLLLHHSTVKNGRLTLDSGASYAVLILPPNDAEMTPQLLNRIRELVRAGATVTGTRPHYSPSLENYPDCDTKVKEIVDDLWGTDTGSKNQEKALGEGHLFQGKPLAGILEAQHLRPDFEFKGLKGPARLLYTHRATGAADIYFVSSQQQRFDSVKGTFRVHGKVPELWHPDTGVIEPAPIWNEQDGRTQVQLNFEPAGSVFVIFRKAIEKADPVVSATAEISENTSSGPKLAIQHALYAAKDGAGTLDVTAKLSQLVRGGELVATVNNSVLGQDPAMNHEKELRVDYTLDGKPHQVVVRENETLVLPAETSSSTGPQWEASATASGAVAVKLWAPGKVELKTASGKVLRAQAATLPAPVEVTGGWNLTFPPNWGAPDSVSLEKLISWTEHTNAGVRYFSGTATYTKEVPSDRLSSGRELWLDLGTVKNFAEVFWNDQSLGVLWKPPFRVNVTAAAKPGKNQLTVKVTNLWPNRLIGDEQLPPDCEWNGLQLKSWPQWLLEGKPSPTGRLTFTTWHHWTRDSKLLESGLLGPVQLRTAENKPAE